MPTGQLYTWDEQSTYVKNPPYFEGMTMQLKPLADVRGARVLALLGDSVTTDHISPAGNISRAVRLRATSWTWEWNPRTSTLTGHGAEITK